MGIPNPNELLFPLFEAFGSASAVKSERDLKNLIDRNRIEWEVILRSGLIQTEQLRFQIVYKFDPVFHPIINDYLVQVGKLAQPETAVNIQKPIPEPTKVKPSTSEIKEHTNQVSETKKKCDYLISLGKKYFDSKNYQDAMANLQRAQKTCDEELFDSELLVEIDGLLRQVEDKMNKEAEEKARIEKEKQLKIKYQNLTNGAQQKFDERQWDSAIALFNNVTEICQKLKFTDGLNFAEDMIVKAKENAKKEAEKNARKEEERAKKLVSFRSAQIPQFQADVLQELETQLKKEFTLVDKVQLGIKMGFSVENQRITGIGLYKCDISTLPESIGNLKSLQTLWLGSNQLTTLPESISKLKSLQTLKLQVNQFSTLPVSISNLKSLQVLWLNNNQLTTLPESIGNLSSLQILRLESNQLATLPESIGNLKSLEKLSLRNNKLRTLPESISDLKSLEQLWLSNNKLTTLPESINNMTALNRLNISGNPLKKRAKSALKQLIKKAKWRKIL